MTRSIFPYWRSKRSRSDQPVDTAPDRRKRSPEQSRAEEREVYSFHSYDLAQYKSAHRKHLGRNSFRYPQSFVVHRPIHSGSLERFTRNPVAQVSVTGDHFTFFEEQRGQEAGGGERGCAVF